MRITRAAISVAVAVGALTWASVTADQRRTPAGVRTAADLAVALAQSGYAAGIVLPLPSRLQSTLRNEQPRSDSFLTARSAFGVWLRNDTSANSEHLALASPADVDASAARVAAGSAITTSRSRDGATYLMKSAAAAVCLASLEKPLSAPVADRNIVQLVTAAVRSATHAKVPGGYIGSCIGTNDFRPDPVTLSAGTSLEDALSAAVAAFGSSVWAAVQDADGHCSVGIIRRSQAAGVCLTAVAGTLEPER